MIWCFFTSLANNMVIDMKSSQCQVYSGLKQINLLSMTNMDQQGAYFLQYLNIQKWLKFNTFWINSYRVNY